MDKFLTVSIFGELIMPTLFRLVCITAFTMLLTACATVINSVDKTVRQSDIPPVGEEKTAELGASLLVQQNVVLIRGRKVTQVTRQKLGLNTYEYSGMYFRANNGEHYCGTYILSNYMNSGTRFLECYTDKQFKAMKLPYEEGEEISQEPTNLQKVLEYSGKTGNSISLFYKEFNGMTDGVFIRPAFTQEFKFDLSESNIIGIKGARIEVIQANNTGITYKVISHFPR